MLNKLIRNIQKLVNLLGYNLIISRFKPNSIFDNQVRLDQKNIKNLKVVLNREIMLKFLPKNGIIAELGVDNGDFSNKIISLTQPKKIYLIDTWDSERYNKNKMKYVKKRFEKEINAGRVII